MRLKGLKIVNEIIQTGVNSDSSICNKWNTLSHSVQSKDLVARCTSRMCLATCHFVVNPWENEMKDSLYNSCYCIININQKRSQVSSVALIPLKRPVSTWAGYGSFKWIHHESGSNSIKLAGIIKTERKVDFIISSCN